MKLDEARKAARYRQQDAADHLGISRQTYIRMEKHPETICIKDAHILADFFNVSVEDIFFDSDCNKTR